MNRFAPFGSEIAPQVLELYPLADFDSPQEAYDSLSADIGFPLFSTLFTLFEAIIVEILSWQSMLPKDSSLTFMSTLAL